MSEKLTLEIPFVHHERNGVLTVQYGANDSVVNSGFDLLQGLGFDVAMCLGYPTLHAWVSRYEGTGYRTLMAWVQVIVGRYYDRLEDEIPSRVAEDVDAPEELRALGVPFFAYGYPAALYDAPCNNLGPHARLEWSADTFLVTFPSRLNDGQIARLAGFRWGYVEWDEGGRRRVTLRQLEVTGRDVWEAHLPLLRSECPAWRYS